MLIIYLKIARKKVIIIYNLSDNSGGFSGVSALSSGGAGIVPTVNLGTSGGGYGAMPVAMPVMSGCGGGFGGGFGGDGIWAILLLALLGRGGFGGGRDCCDNNGVGGAAGFISLHDSVNNGTQAILSSNATQSILAAQHNSDLSNCAGFLQVEKGFGDLGVNLCGQFANLGNLVSAEGRNTNANINQVERELCRSFAATNANITQVGTQGLLAELRTQAQLSSCCCDLQMQAERNKCEIIKNDDANTQKILDKMCSNEIQDLRDKLAASNLANSQCAQNAYLASLINPPITKSVPVYGMTPIFDPVVSARGFCGFNGSSFSNGNGCGGC